MDQREGAPIRASGNVAHHHRRDLQATITRHGTIYHRSVFLTKD